jgi:hypothetical protein
MYSITQTQRSNGDVKFCGETPMSSNYFEEHPIQLTRLDHLFHAIALTSIGQINRIATTQEGAIAAIQLDLLWSVASDSKEPDALMALADGRKIVIQLGQA